MLILAFSPWQLDMVKKVSLFSRCLSRANWLLVLVDIILSEYVLVRLFPIFYVFNLYYIIAYDVRIIFLYNFVSP